MEGELFSILKRENINFSLNFLLKKVSPKNTKIAASPCLSF